MKQLYSNGRNKTRLGPDGVHCFNRKTGLNILLDEISVPKELWSKAPRHVSIALTNACDLSCSHCYAPKYKAILDFDLLKIWLSDLDRHGCIGVGFGGGEPTLYPKFTELCEFVANETNLALTMTTHGQRLTRKIKKTISKNMNFVRVSMDGVNSTYEAIRGRPFREFIENVNLLRELGPFGINFVVNRQTVEDLTDAVQLAEDVDASEFLLLPEVALGRGVNIDTKTKCMMEEWILNYRGKMRLAISENCSDQISICNPFKRESGLDAYAHIDASSILRETSFNHNGVQISGNNIMGAIEFLRYQIEEKRT